MVKGVEPLEVEISPIHYVESARFQRNEVESIHLVEFVVVEAGEVLDLEVAVVSLNALVKDVERKVLHHL